MADKTIQYYDQGSGSIVPVKAKDNGDGTWTMYMANDHLGLSADASASSDSGTFSLIALVKRLLAKFTTQLPAALGQGTMAQSLTVAIASNQSAVAVSGPVTDAQLRASAVPVSASGLPLPSGASTETTLAAVSGKLPATLGQKTGANSLAVVVASDQSAIPILLQAGTARQLSATTTSANTALTSGIKAISVRARGADIRIAIGSTSQTANATSGIFVASGERLDFAVPATANIAVIRDTAASANGTLELTELS